MGIFFFLDCRTKMLKKMIRILLIIPYKICTTFRNRHNFFDTLMYTNNKIDITNQVNIFVKKIFSYYGIFEVKFSNFFGQITMFLRIQSLNREDTFRWISDLLTFESNVILCLLNGRRMKWLKSASNFSINVADFFLIIESFSWSKIIK